MTAKSVLTSQHTHSRWTADEVKKGSGRSWNPTRGWQTSWQQRLTWHAPSKPS